MSTNKSLFGLLSNIGLESRAVAETISMIEAVDEATFSSIDSDKINKLEIAESCANSAAHHYIERYSNLFLLLGSWLALNASIITLSNSLSIIGATTISVLASIGVITGIANILFFMLIMQTVRQVVSSYFIGKMASTNRLIIEKMHDELGEEVSDVILGDIIEWEDID